MKKLIMAALIASSCSVVMAQGQAMGPGQGQGQGQGRPQLTEEQKQEKLTQIKAKISENITKRQELLQKEKTCIDSAKDTQALRACHQNMAQERKQMMGERKQNAQERNGMRQGRMGPGGQGMGQMPAKPAQ